MNIGRIERVEGKGKSEQKIGWSVKVGWSMLLLVRGWLEGGAWWLFASVRRWSWVVGQFCICSLHWFVGVGW